jgi:hypothetical protein
MSNKIDEDEIYKLVKYNYFKYDYNYKKNSKLIIQNLHNEINIQKHQLDFLISKIFCKNKNYRKEVSINFNQKFMPQIGKEVYVKYPDRIKLFENILVLLKTKDNEIKEKNRVIDNYNLFFKIIIVINLFIYIFLKIIIL